MKKTAIVRIVIWSVVALVLTGILISALVFKKNPDAPIISNDYKYDNENEYSVGATELSATAFTSVKVDWISGNIYLHAYDGDKVKVEETSNDDIEEKYELRWLVKDNTLYIRPCKSMSSWSLTDEIPTKDLFVYIPYDLAEMMDKVHIDNASASVNISGITADEFDIASVSGNIWYEKCDANEMKIENVSGYVNITETNADIFNIESVSGNVEIMGIVNSLNIDSVSGEVLLCTNQVPQTADISTVSGDIRFQLPENNGFCIDFDSVSGKVTSEFPLEISNGEESYGNGSRDFDFETVSGNAYIEIKE